MRARCAVVRPMVQQISPTSTRTNHPEALRVNAEAATPHQTMESRSSKRARSRKDARLVGRWAGSKFLYTGGDDTRHAGWLARWVRPRDGRLRRTRLRFLPTVSTPGYRRNNDVIAVGSHCEIPPTNSEFRGGSMPRRR